MENTGSCFIYCDNCIIIVVKILFKIFCGVLDLTEEEKELLRSIQEKKKQLLLEIQVSCICYDFIVV